MPFQYLRILPRPIAQIISLVAFCLVILYWLQSTTRPPEWLSESMDTNTQIKYFLSDWCRIRKMRTDWQELFRPCKDEMSWGLKSTSYSEKTSPLESKIIAWDIRPAGEFSRLWIHSYQRNGKPQRRGGDLWRGKFTGPSSPVITVFDHRNGSYEVTFLPIEHGKYNATFTLEYTTCDGLKEPPPNWFVIGNSQGSEQKDGVLGNEKPFIGEPLRGSSYTFSFDVSRQVSVKYIQEIARILFGPGNVCSEPCDLLWDGYGRWINKTWEPYRVGEDYGSSNSRWTRKRDGILWFYGDSVMEQFYSRNVKNGNLCHRFFHRCGHTYNWVYRINNYNITAAKENTDNLDVNITKIAKQFDEVLSRKSFSRPESALIFNFGLHFVSTVNFTTYQAIINRIIDTISNRRAIGSLKGEIIWRTNTAINKHKLGQKNKEAKRFLTYQRSQAFNAYATEQMCKAGIYILDVFPLTDSYPFGTGWKGKANDAVHYENSVFKSVETFLYHHLRRTDV